MSDKSENEGTDHSATPTQGNGSGFPKWLAKIGVLVALAIAGLAKLADDVGTSAGKLGDNVARISDDALKAAISENAGETWAAFLNHGYKAYDAYASLQELAALPEPSAVVEVSQSSAHEVSTFGAPMASVFGRAYKCLRSDSETTIEVTVNGVHVGRIEDDEPTEWSAEDGKWCTVSISYSHLQEDFTLSSNRRYWADVSMQLEGSELFEHRGELRAVSAVDPTTNHSMDGFKSVQFTYTDESLRQYKEQFARWFVRTLEASYSEDFREGMVVGYDIEMSNQVFAFDHSGKLTVRGGPFSFKAVFVDRTYERLSDKSSDTNLAFDQESERPAQLRVMDEFWRNYNAKFSQQQQEQEHRQEYWAKSWQSRLLRKQTPRQLSPMEQRWHDTVPQRTSSLFGGPPPRVPESIEYEGGGTYYLRRDRSGTGRVEAARWPRGIHMANG